MPQPQDSAPGQGGGQPRPPKNPNDVDVGEAAQQAAEKSVKQAVEDAATKFLERVLPGAEQAFAKSKLDLAETANVLARAKKEAEADLREKIKEAEKTLGRRVSEEAFLRVLLMIEGTLENFADNQLGQLGHDHFGLLEKQIRDAKAPEDKAALEEQQRILDLLSDIFIAGELLNERVEAMLDSWGHVKVDEKTWGDLNEASPGLPGVFDQATTLKSMADAILATTGPAATLIGGVVAAETMAALGLSALATAAITALWTTLSQRALDLLEGKRTGVKTPTELIGEGAPGGKLGKKITRELLDLILGRLKAFLRGYMLARLRAAATLESDPERREFLLALLLSDDVHEQWKAWAKYFLALQKRVRAAAERAKRLNDLAAGLMGRKVLRTLLLGSSVGGSPSVLVDVLWGRIESAARTGRRSVADLLEIIHGNGAPSDEDSLLEILRRWKSIGGTARILNESEYRKADAALKAGSNGTESATTPSPPWRHYTINRSIEKIDQAVMSDALGDALKVIDTYLQGGTLEAGGVSRGVTEQEAVEAAAKIGAIVDKALDVLDKELESIALDLSLDGDQLESLMKDLDKYLLIDASDPGNLKWSDGAPAAFHLITPTIALAIRQAFETRNALRHWRNIRWKRLGEILESLDKAMREIEEAAEEQKKRTVRVETPGAEQRTVKAEIPKSPPQTGLARVAATQGAVVTTFVTGPLARTSVSTTGASTSRDPSASVATQIAAQGGSRPTRAFTGQRATQQPPQAPLIAATKMHVPTQHVITPGTQGRDADRSRERVTEEASATGGGGSHADRSRARGRPPEAAADGPSRPAWLADGRIADFPTLSGWGLAVKFASMKYSDIGVDLFLRTSAVLRSHLYNDMKSAAETGRELGESAVTHSSQFGDDGDRERDLGKEALDLAKEAARARAEARKYLKSDGVPSGPGQHPGAEGYNIVMYAEFKALESQAAGQLAAAEGYLNAVKGEMEANPPANPLFAAARIANAEAGAAEAKYVRSLGAAWAQYYKSMRTWEENGRRGDEPKAPIDPRTGEPREGTPLADEKKAAEEKRAAAEQKIKEAIEAGDTELLNMFDCSTENKPPGFPPECTAEVKAICPDDYECLWYAEGAYDPGGTKGAGTGGGRFTPIDLGAHDLPGPGRGSLPAGESSSGFRASDSVSPPDVASGARVEIVPEPLQEALAGAVDGRTRRQRRSLTSEVAPPDALSVW